MPLVWIEHWPAEAHLPLPESYDLVTFSNYYDIREATDWLQDGPVKEIGEPRWMRLDRETLENLLGRPLD